MYPPSNTIELPLKLFPSQSKIKFIVRLTSSADMKFWEGIDFFSLLISILFAGLKCMPISKKDMKANVNIDS